MSLVSPPTLWQSNTASLHCWNTCNKCSWQEPAVLWMEELNHQTGWWNLDVKSGQVDVTINKKDCFCTQSQMHCVFRLVDDLLGKYLCPIQSHTRIISSVMIQNVKEMSVNAVGFVLLLWKFNITLKRSYPFNLAPLCRPPIKCEVTGADIKYALLQYANVNTFFLMF